MADAGILLQRKKKCFNYALINKKKSMSTNNNNSNNNNNNNNNNNTTIINDRIANRKKCKVNKIYLKQNNRRQTPEENCQDL